VGADLVMASFEWPATAAGHPAQPGDELAAEMARRWDHLAAEGKAKVADWSFGSTEADDLARTEELMAGSIAAFFGDERNWPRDVCRLDHLFGNRSLFVTGGMSWGDDPTDSYAGVLGIALSGITSEPVALASMPGSDAPTHWVVQWHEGGLVQYEDADEGVRVVRFDFDEIDGEVDAEYVTTHVADLRAVPESSACYGLAQDVLASVAEVLAETGTTIDGLSGTT